MTSAERRAEASVVSEIFQAAMTSLGIKTMIDSLALWADISPQPNRVARSSSRWINFALSLVGRRREDARDLTMSYYRLVRALHTGRSIRNPWEGDTDQVSVPLNTLRDEFYDTVDELTPEVLAHDEEEIPVDGSRQAQANDDLPPTPEITDEEQIELDEIDRLQAEVDAIEDAAEEEARTVLEALGPNNLRSKLTVIEDQEQPAGTADQLREEAHRQAGNRQSMAAQRVALNGGRAPLAALSDQDEKVIGYVRSSRTGTPCGWCAMLISRGLILYKTAESALLSDGEKYHDDCNCIAIPVFSEEQYNEAPQFDLNREYEALWPKVTKGLSGDEALTAWRRHFRQLKQAQEAGSQTTERSVQEAA